MDRFTDSTMMTLTSEKVRYDLAESVGPDLQLSDVLDPADMAAIATLSLEYRSAHGCPRLRQAIAVQHDVDADHVVTTVGGMHAIFLCGSILCNKNDHALVQKPGFPLAQSALAFNNADVELLPARFDNGYQLDIEDCVAKLKSNTSLVCLASPQNPSGVAISKTDILDLLDAMRNRSPGAFLLLDETYRQASYGTDEPDPSLVSADERIISCASLSKCHGAPGLRSGWAITRHEALRQQLISGKFQTVISCSGLDEAVALRVLERSDELLAGRRRHLASGYSTVAGFVAKHSEQLAWVAPDAGALCCVRLHPQQFDSARVMDFHRELQGRSVRVAPGGWFGDEPQVFRLGFGLLPVPELEQGLGRIGNVLENLR
ncbi:hypothetical protein AB833_12235 [Chromatiales bacterium (ex Bugula neritina AB1)]|nr:hypothetical protein AB833_12235 [Chromatiales bacterium (ex Bugula neritina AB1)]